MMVTLWGMVTLAPFPVYFVSTPLEIDKPASSMTGTKVAGATVSVLSPHFIFAVDVTKAVILSSLLSVTVIGDGAANTI